MGYNGDGSREYEDIMSLQSDLGATAEEIKKLKEKVTGLTGVCYKFSSKIEILEKQLKNALAQVDLNAQTLEELR